MSKHQRTGSPKVLLSAQDATATVTSDIYYLREFFHISVQITSAGLDAGDSTLDIEVSDDKENWSVLGSATTITAADETQHRSEKEICQGYVRVKYTAGATTAGTVTVKLSAVT